MAGREKVSRIVWLGECLAEDYGLHEIADVSQGVIVLMHMISGLKWVFVAVVTSNCLGALGQAKLGVYGAVGAEKSGISGQGWTNTETVGAYYGTSDVGPVAVAIDGRGVFSSDEKSYLFGPRVAVHLPLFPVKPYAEVLGGMTFYKVPSAASSNGTKNASDFTYRFVGGLDSTIFYHLDWRVIEYAYGGGITEGDRNVHVNNLSTGLVVRF
jgi:hypothetical protein